MLLPSQDIGNITVNPKEMKGLEIEDLAIDKNPNTETFDVADLDVPQNVPLNRVASMVPVLSNIGKKLKMNDKVL